MWSIFDAFLTQKRQKKGKKGQNVGHHLKFVPGWIFDFSMVFKYIMHKYYEDFLKSPGYGLLEVN